MSKEKCVKLMLDYLQGPIWISDIETGEPMTGIPVVDNDPILPALNKECSDLFSSCYEFDSHGESCWFNAGKAMKNKAQILFLLKKIKHRLSEINDGSFIVEDCETNRLNSL